MKWKRQGRLLRFSSDAYIRIGKREEIKQKANNKESQESEVVFRFGLLS